MNHETRTEQQSHRKVKNELRRDYFFTKWLLVSVPFAFGVVLYLEDILSTLGGRFSTSAGPLGFPVVILICGIVTSFVGLILDLIDHSTDNGLFETRGNRERRFSLVIFFAFVLAIFTELVFDREEIIVALLDFFS